MTSIYRFNFQWWNCPTVQKIVSWEKKVNLAGILQYCRLTWLWIDKNISSLIVLLVIPAIFTKRLIYIPCHQNDVFLFLKTFKLSIHVTNFLFCSFQISYFSKILSLIIPTIESLVQSEIVLSPSASKKLLKFCLEFIINILNYYAIW